MKRFRAYWRAWWHLCPSCNSDAPAVDQCGVCRSYRGPFPPPDSLVARWLEWHFAAREMNAIRAADKSAMGH